MSNNLKRISIILTVLLVVILLVVFYLKRERISHPPTLINGSASPTPLSRKVPPDRNVVRCPADVKQCSNGSYVGRIGTSCSFAQCPGDSRY